MHVTKDWKLLYPLNEFYEESGLRLPSATRLDGADMPEQARRLLVHENDMTPILEDAHDQVIHLRVLKRSVRDNVLSRQVVLVLEDDATAVELGAIKIYLGHFPPHARRLLLESKQPLGTILHTQAIAHENHPAAYFQVTADPVMCAALELPAPAVLYGRRNVMVTPAQETLAEVVEILPPTSGFLYLENHRE